MSELKTEIPDMINRLRDASDSEVLEDGLRRACKDAASFLELSTKILYEQYGFKLGQEHVLAAEKVKALNDLYSTHQFG